MNRRLASRAITALAAFGVASIAVAQATPRQQTQATPKGWNYEIRDGKRVPKSDRVTKADGSWREETRVGKCVTIKQKTAAGEYKESRRCDD